MSLRLALRNPVRTREAAPNKAALRGIFRRASLRKELSLPPKGKYSLNSVPLARIVITLHQVDPQKAHWLELNLIYKKISFKSKIPIRDAELTKDNIMEILKREAFIGYLEDPHEETEQLLEEATAFLEKRPLPVKPKKPAEPAVSPEQTKSIFDLMKLTVEQDALSEEDQPIIEELYWGHNLFSHHLNPADQEAVLTLVQQDRFKTSPVDFGEFVTRALIRTYPKYTFLRLLGKTLHCTTNHFSPEQIGQAAFAGVTLSGFGNVEKRLAWLEKTYLSKP